MRFLIVKTSALGDIVHAFPVIDWLKAQFPQATIDWVVEKGGGAALLQAHPTIDRVFIVDTQRWRRSFLRRSIFREIASFFRSLRANHYDVLFDLQGNTKSALFTALAHAHRKVGFGRASVAEWPNLLFTNWKNNPPADVNVYEAYLSLCHIFFGEGSPLKWINPPLKLTRDEELRKRETVAGFTGEPRLMVCPGSHWENKKLDDRVWIELLQKVTASYPLQIFLIYSGEEEKKRVEQMAAAIGPRASILGHLTLPLWQAVMREMAGVAAVDSVGLHLAATTCTPTFSFFGPSCASYYGPQGTEHTAIQGNCPYGQAFTRRCSRLRSCSTGACLKQINPDIVFTQFQEWWCTVQNRYAAQPGPRPL